MTPSANIICESRPALALMTRAGRTSSTLRAVWRPALVPAARGGPLEEAYSRAPACRAVSSRSQGLSVVLSSSYVLEVLAVQSGSRAVASRVFEVQTGSRAFWIRATNMHAKRAQRTAVCSAVQKKEAVLCVSAPASGASLISNARWSCCTDGPSRRKNVVNS